MRTKYRAEKTVIDGRTYDSKKEARRGEELLMLERAGLISDVHFQVPFVLQDVFIHNGKKIEAITYIADATYYEQGVFIVEDTKSVITQHHPVYVLKKKLFLFRYPTVCFRENL